jgi:2-aminoadipate transaminase
MTAPATGPILAAWTRAIRRSALQDLLVATASKDVISLALGLPAADLFPSAALGAAVARLLDRDPRALQYGPPSSELRDFVVALMRRRGVACAPEQVFLTAGAQQGMSLLARLLLEPGSTVMLEDHCYTGFQQVLAPQTVRLVALPTRLETGLDVGAVERALQGGIRPALLYAMADGHNPLGASMPVEERERLVGLARAYGMPILEDDAYGMLSYDGEEPPALRAFDAEWVFHVGSFSKTLAPGLRTGWIVAPERFLGPLASLKESSDIDTATLGQRAVAAFVASGAFEEHVARLRTEYARRRDAMFAALQRWFGAGASWSRPRAGFFIWVDLPEGADAGRLFEVALERERVAFVPGAAFAVAGAVPARSALRLNFSFSPPEVIEEGVARIARALEAMGPPRAGRGRDA